MPLACWYYTMVPEIHLPKSDAAAIVSKIVQRLSDQGLCQPHTAWLSDQLAAPNK